MEWKNGARRGCLTSPRSVYEHLQKIAPVREGGCLLLHPLNQKNPQRKTAKSVLGVLASGNREQSGSETAFKEAMQFTDYGIVVHWGFGLGKIKVIDCSTAANEDMHSLCHDFFGA